MSYFSALMHEPQSATLQRIMQDNFCFNLTPEQYAKLCNRSLSAFKRDFQKLYHTTPGKWLPEKKLHHATQLLKQGRKTISEAAFESGFENISHFSRSFKENFGDAGFRLPVNVVETLLVVELYFIRTSLFFQLPHGTP
ncbi:helix-turn-helix transcriptional regulator [Parafilimonas sp.]|uniref:helix-turn-helix transcriptional regulator n=1 Tax=Parafilimonas sp. TaxID=1969739 RepID=UPI0039E2A33C